MRGLVHEALIKTHLGGELIGYLSRGGTATHARERPVRTKVAEAASEAAKMITPATATPPRKKLDRPAGGEARPVAKVAPLERKRQPTLALIMADISTKCDRGT